MTKASEQKALAEGLALGAVMAGVDSLNGNKTALEFQFRTAWRGWAHADRFPSIKTGPAIDDLFVQVIGRSEGRRGNVAEWRGRWPFVPVLVNDWDDYQEHAELIDDEVPSEDWQELVEAWLTPAKS